MESRRQRSELRMVENFQGRVQDRTHDHGHVTFLTFFFFVSRMGIFICNPLFLLEGLNDISDSYHLLKTYYVPGTVPNPYV